MKKKHGKTLNKLHILLIINCGKVNLMILSLKKKVQDLGIYQLKVQVQDSHQKDEKITTNFKALDESEVINKAYLDEKILKSNGHLSLLEKDYSSI